MSSTKAFIDHPEFSRIILALALAATLCLPLTWLFNESRNARGEAALSSIERIENWGKAQTIDGPWLEVSTLSLFKFHNGEHTPIKQVDLYSPSNVGIDVAVQTTPAHTDPVLYEANVTLRGFIPLDSKADALTIIINDAKNSISDVVVMIENRTLNNGQVNLSNSALRIGLEGRRGTFDVAFNVKGHQRVVLTPPANTRSISLAADGAPSKVISSLPAQRERSSSDSILLRWSPSEVGNTYTGGRAQAGAEQRSESLNRRGNAGGSYGLLFEAKSQGVELERLYIAGPIIIGLILILMLYGERQGNTHLTPIQLLLAASTPLVFFATLFSSTQAADSALFYLVAAVITAMVSGAYAAHILSRFAWGAAMTIMLLLLYGLLWVGTQFQFTALSLTFLGLVALIVLMFANRRPIV